MTNNIFQDEAEKERHEKAIVYPRQTNFIRQRYLQHLKSLQRGASIRVYLSILVAREVKALLRNPFTRDTQRNGM